MVSCGRVGLQLTYQKICNGNGIFLRRTSIQNKTITAIIQRRAEEIGDPTKLSISKHIMKHKYKRVRLKILTLFLCRHNRNHSHIRVLFRVLRQAPQSTPFLVHQIELAKRREVVLCYVPYNC